MSIENLYRLTGKGGCIYYIGSTVFLFTFLCSPETFYEYLGIKGDLFVDVSSFFAKFCNSPVKISVVPPNLSVKARAERRSSDSGSSYCMLVLKKFSSVDETMLLRSRLLLRAKLGPYCSYHPCKPTEPDVSVDCLMRSVLPTEFYVTLRPRRERSLLVLL